MLDSIPFSAQENTALQPILTAVDFSEDSRTALLWAGKLAKCFNSPITVLHVVHEPAADPGFYHSETKDSKDSIRTLQKAAELKLSAFMDEAREACPDSSELESAQTLLVAGLPPGRISEIAKSLDAKMIVIGSRGLTGLPHLMIGSVAERVVHLASQPVVVVKSRQVTADEQPHSPVETQDNDSE